MLPIMTESKAQMVHPKVSKQLRDLLECNNQLRLGVTSFSCSV